MHQTNLSRLDELIEELEQLKNNNIQFEIIENNKWNIHIKYHSNITLSVYFNKSQIEYWNTECCFELGIWSENLDSNSYYVKHYCINSQRSVVYGYMTKNNIVKLMKEILRMGVGFLPKIKYENEEYIVKFAKLSKSL